MTWTLPLAKRKKPYIEELKKFIGNCTCQGKAAMNHKPAIVYKRYTSTVFKHAMYVNIKEDK